MAVLCWHRAQQCLTNAVAYTSDDVTVKVGSKWCVGCYYRQWLNERWIHPHVHYEIIRNNTQVDPFCRTCSRPERRSAAQNYKLGAKMNQSSRLAWERERSYITPETCQYETRICLRAISLCARQESSSVSLVLRLFFWYINNFTIRSVSNTLKTKFHASRGMEADRRAHRAKPTTTWTNWSARDDHNYRVILDLQPWSNERYAGTGGVKPPYFDEVQQYTLILRPTKRFENWSTSLMLSSSRTKSWVKQLTASWRCGHHALLFNRSTTKTWQDSTPFRNALPSPAGIYSSA